jgi:hypothetical protein
VKPYLIYGYKFKTTKEIKDVLEKLIDLRVPNDYILPNKTSNDDLKKIYYNININNIDKKHDCVDDFLYYINTYYHNDGLYIDAINGYIFVMPNHPQFWIDLSETNKTSIKKLTEDVDYSLSRKLIYFMENNNLNYINTELDWHYFIDCKVNQ